MEGDLQDYIPTQRTYGNIISTYNGCTPITENIMVAELMTMESRKPVDAILRLCHHIAMT